MNSFAVIVFSLCAALCFAAAPNKPHGQNSKPYTTKYDNIDLDQILNNPKLVRNYVTCITTNKGCTPQGTELREHLPDALKTQCEKCSEAQKRGALKVIDKLQSDYPEEWKKLSDKWDPTGELFRKLQAAQNNHQLPGPAKKH